MTSRQRLVQAVLRVSFPLLIPAAFNASALAQRCETEWDCYDGNDCTTEICQEGRCVYRNAPEGTRCEDGDPCTVGDACRRGTCAAGQPVDCNDGNSCTQDYCDPGSGGCVYAPVPDWSSCDDGNPCTWGDICWGGFCYSGPPTDCNDGNPCTQDYCDPSSGGCVHAPMPDWSSCDDGNACTQGDICWSGFCYGGPPPDCNDGHPCTQDFCDPSSGSCMHTPAPDGTSCDNGDPCTYLETCQGGVCGGGSPVTCGGGDLAGCIVGVCDPAQGGCVYSNASDGTACSDSNACTTQDACWAGACVGTPLACPPPSPCQEPGICSAETSRCWYPSKPDGTACDDGSACTAQDACWNGYCLGTVNCPAPDSCHEAGMCTESGACWYPQKPEETACDDGNTCTSGDSCRSGVCAGANSVTCTAVDECHQDGVCDPRTGICSNPPIPNCQIIELSAVADTTVDSLRPDLNLGSEPTLQVGWTRAEGEATLRTLVRFPPLNLSADAQIDSARLKLSAPSGNVAVVSRVTDEWSERAVTWKSQPGYGRPAAEPVPGTPGEWDVTGIVQTWNLGLYSDYGLGLVENRATPGAATYTSREGGQPPRLRIVYRVIPFVGEPTQPPGSGPPTFTLAPELQPAEQPGPIIVNGQPVARPVAAWQADGDQPYIFIADQVILTAPSPQALAAFLTDYGGSVLRGPDLPAPPPDLAGIARNLPPDQDYLVKVDTNRVNPSTLAADAAILGMRGQTRVSSEQGRRLLALVVGEHNRGLAISFNPVARLFASPPAFPPLTYRDAGLDDPINDVNHYPEMSDTAVQHTGVNRAWQYLAFSTRKPQVWLAVIDGGFPLAANGTPCTDAAGQAYLDLPQPYYQYDFSDDDYNASGVNSLKCSGGMICPYHGSGTSAISTAVANNQYGIAGAGSPVARLIMLRHAGDIHSVSRAIRTATQWGASVTSMSLGFTCDSACMFFGSTSGYSKLKNAMVEADAANVFTVSAAGNDNKDLANENLFPCMFAWNSLCVGALANNSRNRAGFSNYGTKSALGTGTGGVNMWAPGDGVRVGPDIEAASNHTVSGTSIATPFVAGAAALARGVKPELTNAQLRGLFFSTCNPPVQAVTKPGSLNVLKLVQSAAPPLNDRFGWHSNDEYPESVTADGLTDLVILPQETDYYVYTATRYLQSVTVAAEYVEAIGDLQVDSATPGPSSGKVTGLHSAFYQRVVEGLCAGDILLFQVRGLTPLVANAYRLTIQEQPSLFLRLDAHESDDTPATAKPLAVKLEESWYQQTQLQPDCRAGLTLHTASDVDYHTFTLTSADFTSTHTGIAVTVEAGVALTASLERAGQTLATATDKFIELEVPDAQPGNYLVRISGTSVNAYDLRARVYDPRSRIRATKLEEWLKSLKYVQPHPPLPGPWVIPDPLPEPFKTYPFEDATLYGWGKNGVMVLPEGQSETELDVPAEDGGPRVLAIGSLNGGLASMGIEEVSSAPSGDCDGDAPGIYAMMIDSEGRELWRVEGTAGPVQRTIPLTAGHTSLLLINGCYRMKLRLRLGTPGLFVLADFDADGDVDSDDATRFEACASGPAVPHDGTSTCQVADFDHDADVDQSDFAFLQRCFSGQNKPTDPDCAN